MVSTSVGVAIAPHDGNTTDQLLRNADMALYRAKADGRGNYHFFQPEMDAQMQERRTLELHLRKALLAEEFELYYQPLVDAKNGMVTGFEALLRWNHPERGLVPPDAFIPVAEEIGLIVPLGQWILEEACRQVRCWQLVYPEASRLVMSINLAARQFQKAFLADVVGIVVIARDPARCGEDEAGVPPDQLGERLGIARAGVLGQ